MTCLLGLKKLNVVKNVRQKTAAGVRSQNAIKLSLKPDADAAVKSTLRLIWHFLQATYKPIYRLIVFICFIGHIRS